MTHDRRRRWVSGLLVLLALAAGGVAVWSLSGFFGERTQLEEKVASGEIFVSRDLEGRRVVWDIPPDLEQARAVPSGGTFDAPEQGLSVPLVEVSLAGGVINPPTMLDAFRYREFGDPHDVGTGLVVVAMHAVRDGRAPGNYLATAGSGVPQFLVEPGDPLVVDGVAYTVTEIFVASKDDVAADERLWGEDAGRHHDLAVISCLQHSGVVGWAVENVVVLAERTA